MLLTEACGSDISLNSDFYINPIADDNAELSTLVFNYCTVTASDKSVPAAKFFIYCPYASTWSSCTTYMALDMRLSDVKRFPYAAASSLIMLKSLCPDTPDN